MRVCVLASGSKGNSTYIESHGIKLLIDAGTNAKYIETQLNGIGTSLKEIDYVLISHIHDDHISALKVVLNKSKATLLMPKLMYQKLPIAEFCQNVIFYEDDYYIANLKITSIKSSHDSPDSRNFIIEDESSSVVYITDTGYVNTKNFCKLRNKNIYLMESNHDIEMLNNGPYPKWLKARVLSDLGHLSNNASSVYLTKKIVLMHLSEINNTKEKALETIKETFREYEIKFKDILVSDQYEKIEMIEI